MDYVKEDLPCSTEDCEGRVLNGNMQVCDACFKRLYDENKRALWRES